MKVKWNFETEIEYSSPTVVGDTVFIGYEEPNSDKAVCALDVATGSTKWEYCEYNTNKTYLSPTVTNGSVFVGGLPGTDILCLSADTGEKIWDFKSESQGNSPPIVSDGSVFIKTGNQVIALNAATGKQQWSFEPDDPVGWSAPVVVNGTVFAVYGGIYALDADTGKKQWQFNTHPHEEDGSPTVRNGTVYIGSYDGSLYAIDATDGIEKWSYSIDNGYSAIISSPTVSDGIVFFGGGRQSGHIHAINASTGDPVWKTKLNDSVCSSPTLVKNTIYIGSWSNKNDAEEGYIHALDVTSGKEIKRIPTGPIYESSPIVVDGTLFVGSGTKGLIAIDTDDEGSSKGSLTCQGTLGHHHTYSYRASAKPFQTLAEQEQSELQKTLTAAERALYEAITAYIDGQQTLPRIRFRQAENAYCSALDKVEKFDICINKPIEIDIRFSNDTIPVPSGENKKRQQVYLWWYGKTNHNIDSIGEIVERKQQSSMGLKFSNNMD